MNINPVLLEIYKNRFSSIAEEMGVTLCRTAFSPNIKERRDFSCAIFNDTGDMVAQAAHIPVHLGSMPMSVKTAIFSVIWQEGDMVVLNDPFKGGTHLPDITIVAPVFTSKNTPSFFVANRAHHADVGGMSPGSMPLSSSIFQEGLIIPPLKIVEKGKTDRKVIDFILSNVRTPQEREGDFLAQIMANLAGAERLQVFIEKKSFKTVEFYAKGLMDYAELIIRNAIKNIPDGAYEFEDFLDDDGLGKEKIRIHLNLIINSDEAVFDFQKSGSQVPGCVNAVYSITLSAVLYVLCLISGKDSPVNAGCLRPVKVLTKKGSLLDAVFPAAVAGGNVETSQRIVDVILGALSTAVPEIIPAASQGTMNNISIGGVDPETGRQFAYYETIAGGMGASSFGRGESAVHSHMTNTLNTPVEALEYSYPFLVTQYSIRHGSGGQGSHCGGDGIVREIMLLSDAKITVLSDRRKFAPWGREGGGQGLPGRNIAVKKNVKKNMPGKFSESFEKGNLIRVETPGGGGCGKKA